MTHPKILVSGNHTCGNRGDAAILRGLMNALESARPDAEFTITSRYPTSSSYLIGRPMEADIFAGNDIIDPGRNSARRRRAVPWTLLLRDRSRVSSTDRLLSAGVKRRIQALAAYDLVVHVGGSMFVDLYGYGHFETDFAAFIAGVPVILCGQSIGPVTRGRYPIFMRHLLRRAQHVTLRETVSRDLLAKAGMPLARVEQGVDTAWNIEPASVANVQPAQRFFPGSERPLLAITARVLAPFDQLLGITQAEYETAFAGLIDRFIDAGYNVLALSTCTGIDSYHRDDRMVALNIGKQVDKPAHYQVVMDELDDLELGAYFRACDLLVATRLHSAIIAMNFGTPALAMAYEHKSIGTLRDMGLEALSAEVAELLDGRLAERALAVAAERHDWAQRIKPAVTAARVAAQDMVRRGLQAAGF